MRHAARLPGQSSQMCEKCVNLQNFVTERDIHMQNRYAPWSRSRPHGERMGLSLHVWCACSKLPQRLDLPPCWIAPARQKCIAFLLVCTLSYRRHWRRAGSSSAGLSTHTYPLLVANERAEGRQDTPARRTRAAHCAHMALFSVDHGRAP